MIITSIDELETYEEISGSHPLIQSIINLAVGKGLSHSTKFNIKIKLEEVDGYK